MVNPIRSAVFFVSKPYSARLFAAANPAAANPARAVTPAVTTVPIGPSASGFICGLALWTVCGLAAQTLSAQTWILPQGTAVKDNGPRIYRFSGTTTRPTPRARYSDRQRVTGDYTRGLVGGEVMWKNVRLRMWPAPLAPFPTAQKRDFMEGFRYRNDVGSTMKPDFFKGFPPTAVMERNLVWDTGMIEMFGQNYFDHLKLNEPYHISRTKTVPCRTWVIFTSATSCWSGSKVRNAMDRTAPE